APRGFTLIEVLMAMVLMAIILPAITRGISVSLHSAEQAKNLAEAAALADMQLNSILVSGVGEGDSRSNVVFNDWPDYSWSYATYAATDRGIDNMLQVDL